MEHLNVPLLVSIADYLLVVVLVPRVLLRKDEAGNIFAWLLLIVFVPFLGAALWWIFGFHRIRRRRRKLAQIQDEAESALARSRPGTEPELKELSREVLPERGPSRRDLLRLAERVERFPATPGNDVRLYEAPDEAFAAMLDAVAGARSHILFETYLFRADRAGRRMLDLLADRAAEGLRVHLLVDGVGSFDLSESALARFKRSGGRAARFAPVRPISRPWSLHFRNHRKLLSIDGRIGFLGSFNIGEEYFPYPDTVKAPWRNQLLRIEGPAARCLEEVCAEDWLFATEEDPLADLPPAPLAGTGGGEVVQIVRSGPVDLEERTLHRLTFAAISSARTRIKLTTPYFVPDEPILVALETAAGRGVEVELLLPARSDVALVLAAGRSHYPRLLEAGCRIYEYEAGILHSKSLVVDGLWSTIGSANMDRRSFYLNFEANAVVYGESLASRLEESFERDKAASRRIEQPVYENRLVQAATKLIAPLL